MKQEKLNRTMDSIAIFSTCHKPQALGLAHKTSAGHNDLEIGESKPRLHLTFILKVNA